MKHWKKSKNQEIEKQQNRKTGKTETLEYWNMKKQNEFQLKNSKLAAKFGSNNPNLNFTSKNLGISSTDL